MIGVLEKLVDWCGLQIPGIPAAGVVPDSRGDERALNRPERFITVERTGGARSRFIDRGQYVIQVWDTSILEADMHAHVLANLCLDLGREPWVAAVRVGNVYNFPDPVSGQARYQIVLELDTMIEQIK